MRLRVGDELTLFDGAGGEYAARISEVARERVSVDVLHWRDVDCEAPLRLTLVQALQAGEKMDMTMQKAVELGVSRIVPVASKRSVVRLDGERAQRQRTLAWRRGVGVRAVRAQPGSRGLAALRARPLAAPAGKYRRAAPDAGAGRGALDAQQSEQHGGYDAGAVLARRAMNQHWSAFRCGPEPAAPQ